MEELDLRRPIYKKTAAFGHFGRTEPEFTWERTDKAAALKSGGLAGRAASAVGQLRSEVEAGEETSHRDGGPRGRRCCFGRLHAPAAPRWRSPRPTDGTVPGAFHVHTNRSDGLSGPDEIAAAAARAGLKFVVFTDHGDAHAHARSAGLPLRRALPRRRRDQHERRALRRARHAAGAVSARRRGARRRRGRPPPRRVRHRRASRLAASRSCAGASGTAPFDGVELLNLDTGWRLWAEQAARIGGEVARAGATCCGAPRLSVPAGRDHRGADPVGRRACARNGPRWPRGGRSSTLAGVDAHARLDLQRRSRRQPLRAAAPGYESSFRVLSIHVRPGQRADRRRGARRARSSCARSAPGISTPRSTRSRRRRRSSSRRPTIAARRTQGDRARGRRTGDAARPQQRAAGVHDHGLERRQRRSARIITSRTSRVQAPAGAGRLPGRDPRARPARRVDRCRRCRGSAATRSTSRAPTASRPPRGTRRRRPRASRSSTAGPPTGGARSTTRRRSPPSRRRRSSAAPSCASATGWPAAIAPGRVAALAFDTPRGIGAVRSPGV